MNEQLELSNSPLLEVLDFLFFGNTSSKIVRAKILPDTNVCGWLAGSNRPYFSTSIPGVVEATSSEYPWLALLEYETPQGRKSFCGGVLISSRYVLTAAHCIKDNLVSVRLGEYDVTTERDCENKWDTKLEDCLDPPKIVDVEEKIPYESYIERDKNHHGDIALLRLKAEVAFSDFIRPICLPLSEELKSRDYAGIDMAVAGWDKTTTIHSNVKLESQVPVLSDSNCSAYYERYRVNVIGSQLCAGGEKGEDSWYGDSGGPLMHTIDSEKLVAIGVLSFEPNKCGSGNLPALYTRVPSFMDWILSNLKP